MRLAPVEDYPTPVEWFSGLPREDVGGGKEWIFCSGCSNGLYRDWDGYTDPYSADAPVKYPTRWIEVHYDCDKEYIEVDDTVMDWLGG